MENPYEAPQNFDQPAVSATGSGMVGQVPIVAILLIVQGGLETVVGLILAATAVIVPFAPQPPGAPQSRPGGTRDVFIAVGAMALVMLAAAVLKIYAGWKNYQYRGRVLGFVAFASGLVSLFTCYCFPTALALSVYGLIVYLNGNVARAFDMGNRGFSVEQIKAEIARPQYPPAI